MLADGLWGLLHGTGLFDCHVHLMMDPSGNLCVSIPTADRTTATALRSHMELNNLMERNALKLLDAGVTSARDLGCPGTFASELRDRINSGKTMGPRMMVSNAPITVPGGHCGFMGGEAAGERDVRAMVRKRVAEKVDIIKVMATGGFLTPGSHPSQARYTVEELVAIRDEAHKAGLKVTTHAQGVEGIRRAVEAGFDCIEHCAWSTKEGTQFDRNIADQIVEKGIAVCPTMNTACSQDCYFCPWDVRENLMSNLSSLRKAGARTIIGTDAGIRLCHFERYADGLAVMVDAGYTNRQIIHSATAGAAFECGLQGITGKLLPGMDADLAAFEGNPLEDIKAFLKPTFVMARGRRHTLTPIAPLGDVSEEIQEIYRTLRRAAGLLPGDSNPATT